MRKIPNYPVTFALLLAMLAFFLAFKCYADDESLPDLIVERIESEVMSSVDQVVSEVESIVTIDFAETE